MSIHIQLVANNDLLNLDTWDTATAPTGRAALQACYTQPQVTGCSNIDTRQVRDRADRRRVELRHRPPCARPSPGEASRSSASLASRIRPPATPGSRHQSATCTRSTTSPTRWATSSPATTRSTGTSSTARAGTATPSTSVEPGKRPVDHGLRGHLPHGRRAAAQRRLLLEAQPAGDQQHASGSVEAPISEVQTVWLPATTAAGMRRSRCVTFGTGYDPVAADQAAAFQPINAPPNEAPFPRQRRSGERQRRSRSRRPRRRTPCRSVTR